MKHMKTPMIFAVIAIVCSLLTSCTPEMFGGCTVYDNSGVAYADANCNGTADIFEGYGTTTTGSTGTAFATGSMMLTQAYADLDADGWADLAGENTVAGGRTDMRYRAIRMTQSMWNASGITGMNQDDYGLILSDVADAMSVDIFFDDIKNIWKNQSGQKIVFEYYVTGYQLGSFSATGYQNRMLPDGSTVSQQKCTGAVIMAHITGYKIM